jgi:hypothetical protein
MSVALAQPPAKPAPVPTVTALMVEVTISRHLGEKRISSTPYELSVIPGDRSQLRMGGDVPVPSITFTPQKEDGGKPANPLTSFGYRSIGTDIDVTAAQPVDGQYRLNVTIEESSIYPAELAPATTKTTGAPAFRRFRSSNSVAFRDGQSLEYVMATDRISGEVYRVTVKMTVVK